MIGVVVDIVIEVVVVGVVVDLGIGVVLLPPSRLTHPNERKIPKTQKTQTISSFNIYIFNVADKIN